MRADRTVAAPGRRVGFLYYDLGEMTEWAGAGAGVGLGALGLGGFQKSQYGHPLSKSGPFPTVQEDEK